ncbi:MULTISPECIES: alkene reductase [unclassified Sphingomonas]|uniref:alkene reductase n=1 Tax=unclassified Sphingomonas TaxID=196159 RepID=UPI0009262453|nr:MULTISPECIES: alkene reductase [unclassified Sphingomonas]MBN8846563.1 alkene reductase [Sphingomonas sp.]OJV31034.1 MAG: alkene reductase [Sphingomonas sp. 67-36]
MPSLFDPIALGAIHAPNRIIMAPLTRTRATEGHVPTELMIEYYRQRAGAGLIISEATGISRQGLGWPSAPGLWLDSQVEAWKPVTEAVHRAGGRIVAQLWHMGRLARPDVSGLQSLSSSAKRAPYAVPEKNPYDVPRPATLDDIRQTLDDYAAATRNALAAGFDGVQIHAANGYFIDQFLRDGVNDRDDDYGGPPENRIRLLREVTERVIAEAGADRTAVRLSPNGDSQGADDSNAEAVFIPAVRALDALGIAFLELREQSPDGTFGSTDVPKLSPKIRAAFARPLVLNQDYSLAAAQADLDSGLADAISWGRLFIANPDLVERFRTGAPLNEPNPKTFYKPGPEGYIDYPALEMSAA